MNIKLYGLLNDVQIRLYPRSSRVIKVHLVDPSAYTLQHSIIYSRRENVYKIKPIISGIQG